MERVTREGISDAEVPLAAQVHCSPLRSSLRVLPARCSIHGMILVLRAGYTIGLRSS